MDLLDLAGPQLPGALEYTNATRPQMMPQAPSIAAGWMYGGDMARHDGALANLAKQAQMRAQLDAQRAEEFSAAGPGRMAEIRNKTALAEDDSANMGEILGARSSKRKVDMDNDEVKLMQNELKKVEPFLNAWEEASEEEKPMLLEMMRNRGVKFGKMEIGTLQPKEADLVMKALRRAQTDTPKMKELELGAKTKVDVANIQGSTRERINERRMAHAERVRQYAQQNKLPTHNNVIAAIELKLARKEELNDKELEILNNEYFFRGLAASAAAANKPGQISIQNGRPVTTPPTVPQVPTMTNNPPKGGEGASFEPPATKKTPPEGAVAKYKALMKAAKSKEERDAINAEWTKKFN